MNKRKLLCLLLCLVMVASLAVPGTFALEEGTPETTAAATQPTVGADAPTDPTETTEGTIPETTVATVPETTEATEAVETTQATEPSVPETTVPETTVANEPTVPETTVETVPDPNACSCGAADGVHAEDCPQYVTAEDEEPKEIAYREVSECQGLPHSVSGMIPEGVTLFVGDPRVSLFSLFGGDASDDADVETGDYFAKMNVSLIDEETMEEWQPLEGSPVTVTLDISEYGLDEGDHVMIQHVHEVEGRDPEIEWIGPCVIKDDKISFEMSKFSTLYLYGTNVSIENVKAFYPVSSYETNKTLPDAGNGQWYIVGVYTDTSGVVHLLIGSNGKMPDLNKISHVTVNGVAFKNPGAKGYVDLPEDARMGSFKQYSGTITKIRLDNADVMDITQTNAKSLGGMLDIALDNQIQISDEFSLSLKANTGGSSTSNSFNIGGIQVELHLEYNVEKTVYKVNGTVVNAESAIVSAGNEVIFKIVINNGVGSNTALADATLTDTLPDCFDKNTMVWSADANTWNSSITVNELRPGESQTVYVKAKVLANLTVTADATYTNTATLYIPGQISAEDTADVVVEAPKTGELTISKTVVQDYENDQLPDDSFTFTVDFAGDHAGKTFTYTVNNSEGTQNVIDGGTITLKADQTATFNAVPLGAVTVTETADSDYETSCSVNGGQASSSTVAYGEVSATSPTAIHFTNTYKRHLQDLTITKSGADLGLDPKQSFLFTVTGNGMTFHVVICGNDSKTIKDLPLGEYTVTEDADWSWRYEPTNNGQKVTLTADEAGKVTITNSRKEPGYWLDGNSKIKRNWFDRSGN